MKIPKIAVAASVAGGVGNTVKNELEVIEWGMFEHAGIKYQPIYEQHANGAEVSLHPRVSGVFIETNFVHTVITSDGTKNGWREERYTQYDVDPETIVDYFSQKSPGDKKLYNEIRERKIHLPTAMLPLQQKTQKILTLGCCLIAGIGKNSTVGYLWRLEVLSPQGC